MIQSNNLLLTSVVILTILISATIISYTRKFHTTTEKQQKPTNQMYDPEYNNNTYTLCVLSQNAYNVQFNDSPCYNKTLLQWYNPWVRYSTWREYWKEKAKIRLKVIIQKTENNTVKVVVNETVPPKVRKEVEKPKEKPIEFVYSILVGLIVISGIAACWEVFKDKMKNNGDANGTGQEKECPLADFTINRHLRRESKQQGCAGAHLPRQGSLELTSKVTQTLIHQSSLDRGFPKKIPEALTQESRRNSVPVFATNDLISSQNSPSNPKIMLLKRQSIDIPGEDQDLKKKPRHFIRRH